MSAAQQQIKKKVNIVKVLKRYIAENYLKTSEHFVIESSVSTVKSSRKQIKLTKIGILFALDAIHFKEIKHNVFYEPFKSREDLTTFLASYKVQKNRALVYIKTKNLAFKTNTTLTIPFSLSHLSVLGKLSDTCVMFNKDQVIFYYTS
jgi:hypothetical protein